MGSVMKNKETKMRQHPWDLIIPKAAPSYLERRRLCRGFGGGVRQMAPALDGFTAGHLVDVLLEHGQQFFHSIHNQLVQSADNQIVDETDEAEWTREKGWRFFFFPFFFFFLACNVTDNSEPSPTGYIELACCKWYSVSCTPGLTCECE